MCFLLADHAKSRSQWSTKVSHDLEEFLTVIKGNFKGTAKIKGLATRDGQTSKIVEGEDVGGWRETSQNSR